MPGEFNFEGGSNIDPNGPPWRQQPAGFFTDYRPHEHEHLKKRFDALSEQFGRVLEVGHTTNQTHGQLVALAARVAQLEQDKKILDEPVPNYADEQGDYDPLTPGNKVWEKISGNGPFLILQEWKRDSRPPAARVDLEEPGRSVIQQIDLDDALVVQDKKGALLIRAKSQLTPIQPMPQGLAAFAMALRRMSPGLWSLIVSLLAIILASVAVGSALL